MSAISKEKIAFCKKNLVKGDYKNLSSRLGLSLNVVTNVFTGRTLKNSDLVLDEAVKLITERQNKIIEEDKLFANLQKA